MVLSQRLKNQAKRLGVRLMVKRGNKRVYKSPAVLRKQIKNKATVTQKDCSDINF